MQTCPQCRAQQLNGVLFCSECGGSLFDATPRRESTASLAQSQTPDLHATLTVAPAPNTKVTPRSNNLSLVVVTSGRRITLDAGGDLLVGRKDNAKGIYPHVDLGLDDGYDAGVSRRHAIIALGSSGWAITDLGSANGTFVNGKQLAPQRPVPIRSGDELAFGTLMLRVEL